MEPQWGHFSPQPKGTCIRERGVNESLCWGTEEETRMLQLSWRGTHKPTLSHATWYTLTSDLFNTIIFCTLLFSQLEVGHFERTMINSLDRRQWFKNCKTSAFKNSLSDLLQYSDHSAASRRQPLWRANSGKVLSSQMMHSLSYNEFLGYKCWTH